MTESKFCVKCGTNLPAGAQYCNKCGAIVAGTEADAMAKQQETETLRMVSEGKMNFLLFLFVIYAIPVIIAGAIALCNIDSNITLLWQNKDWLNYVAQHPEVTQDLVRSQMTAGGWMAVVSGICAAISAICCYKRKFWVVATVCSFIATVLVFWSLFGLLIGFFVSWMTLASKEDFVNDTPKIKDSAGE